MQVIPSINVSSFEEAQELVDRAKEFLIRPDNWLHFDIGDGVFSSIKTGGSSEEFKKIKLRSLRSEVHLMVEDPEKVAEAWLEAGAKRLIVHLEEVRKLETILNLCQQHKADFMLTINPETIVENLLPYLNDIKYFQILGVTPGKAGQKFQKSVLEKIEFLREQAPNVKIEVDGGVDLETAKLIKDAGADMIVSATYIFNNADPKEAYNQLKAI
jgi:ribulose-phosphate 3-epimerase